MNVNEVLQYYTALKLHFSDRNYDFFKYKGQVKYALDLDKRKDKWQLQKIAKHPDPFGLMLANFSVNNTAWAGDIISDIGLKTYKEWQKRMESLTYTFREDLGRFKSDMAANIAVPPNSHPYAFKLLLGGHICLETIVILNHYIELYTIWDNKLKDDLAWQIVKHSIVKYSPFVKFNKNACSKIIQEQFNS